MQCKVGYPRWTKPSRHALAGRKRTRSGSKLPAANSRSGSLDGFGISGNQFHDGWLVAGAVQDEVRKILEATKSI